MSPFRREHNWPEGEDPPVPYFIECRDCHFELGPMEEPLPLCPGPRSGREAPSLGRTQGLKRRTPLRDVSPDRDRKRRQRGVYGPFHDWTSRQACILSSYDPSDGCSGEVVGHHVLSVGSGHGDFREANDGTLRGNEVPLCVRHHEMVHRMGRRSFEQEFGIDLLVVAEQMGRQWDGDPYRELPA